MQRIASAFRDYTTGNAADAYQPKPAAGLSHRALSQDREGRKHITCHGHIARSKLSRQCARREREPWLVVASPELVHLSPRQLVTLYSRRMQIEASFRDLKSHRYGQAF